MHGFETLRSTEMMTWVSQTPDDKAVTSVAVIGTRAGVLEVVREAIRKRIGCV
jgi:hypothetical protein